MTMAVNLALVQYSDSSATYDIAKIMEAAAAEAGADVRLRRVEEIAAPDVIQQNDTWQAHTEATRRYLCSGVSHCAITRRSRNSSQRAEQHTLSPVNDDCSAPLSRRRHSRQHVHH